MADNWQLKAVLSANSTGMVKALTDVGKVAKTTRKYLADVASAANHLTGKIGLPLTALSGLLGGFSLVAIKNAVVGFTEMGEEIYKASLRTGMTVEELQRMKYVSEQAGVPVESLQMGMAKLNKQIGDAATGKNKSLSGLLDKLGISARDANGQFKAGIDILPQLADAFVRNKNPVVQAQMGMALFGKSWQEMIPLLMEGSDGISNSLERFARLKGVMNLDDIKGAKELGDKFQDLQFVTKGFQNTIAKELMPVLGPLVEDIIQWAAANRKVVSAGVREFVTELVASMRQIDWQGVVRGVQGFAQSMGRLVDWVGGAKNALIILAVVINAQTIMAVFSLVAALGRAGLAFLGMAAKAYLAGNAALLSMVRVAAAALFTAGPLGVLGAAFAWMGGMATAAGGLISSAMGAVTLAIRGVGAALMANPLGVILGLATAAVLIYENWGTLKEWFGNFFGWIGDKFQAVIGWATDLARSVGGFFGGGATAPSGTAASDPLGVSRPALVGPAARVQASGQIEVSFKDAPAGMRVTQTTVGNVPVNTSVGYRSDALGMP